MLNWSVDAQKLKQSNKQYSVWRLIQLINYGLDEKKLQKKDLVKYWNQVKTKIDPYKKRALEYLIWGKQYSLPNNDYFWTK